jgi:hypothetical protein
MIAQQCLLLELGGTPLIDDSCDTRSLLTLACAIRQQLDSCSSDLISYANPEVARRCYAHMMRADEVQIRSQAPGSQHLVQIQATIQEITNLHQGWVHGFGIPITWRILLGHGPRRSTAFSASNPLIPQHIFLGSATMHDSQVQFGETLVHEVSHVWLGLIEEVSLLARRVKRQLRLPSGHLVESLVDVVYALAFATTAVKYHRLMLRQSSASDLSSQRIDALTEYAQRCMHTLLNADELLPDGVTVMNSCARFLSNDEHPSK